MLVYRRAPQVHRLGALSPSSASAGRVSQMRARAGAAGLWQRMTGTARWLHDQAVSTPRPLVHRCSRPGAVPAGWANLRDPRARLPASGELGADHARQGVQGLVGAGESAAAQRPP